MGTPMVGDILYRAEACVTSAGGVSIAYIRYRVERLTPCGVWIVDVGCDADPDSGGIYHLWLGSGRPVWRRWPGVFAWATREEAVASLKRRSIRRYRHAERRFEDAKRVLACLDLKPPAPPSLLAAWEPLW